jgi:hypothetical protein
MAWEVGHPVNRDGTNQAQRLQDALRPELNPVDGRRAEDFLLFLANMAAEFNFYNDQNQLDDDNDWKNFFLPLAHKPNPPEEEPSITIESIRAYLSTAERRADNSIFLTLLLAFLQMYGHVQRDLNGLTQKHLNFFYRQVLGFQSLPAKPDKVHVLFELAPHVRQHHLPAGTALSAGNDAAGKPLVYAIERDIVLNQAKVAALKTTLVSPEGRVYASEKADSADGLGAPLNPDLPQWPLFGDPEQMQAAQVGFALASPLLLLKEGERIIFLSILFKTEIDPTVDKSDFQSFSAFASGPDEWIPLQLSVQGLTVNRVDLLLTLKPDQPPVVGYNPKALPGQIPSSYPVIKLLLDTTQYYYNKLRNLQVEQIKMHVEVTASESVSGIKDLLLINDQGPVPPGGLMFPFGVAPSSGNSFYIGSGEVFSKPLSKLSLVLNWANLPEDTFEGYYDAYPQKYKNIDNYEVSLQVLVKGKWTNSSTHPLFKNTAPPLDRIPKKISINQSVIIDSGNITKLLLNPEIQELSEFSSSLLQGFIRLDLTQDFGHQIFPSLYARVAKTSADLNFPNPPYTPTLKSISLGYISTVQVIFPEKTSETAHFIHILPFGADSNKKNFLLPNIPHAALYIGIKDLIPPQSLNLLFHIAEGSSFFSNTIIRPEDIEWSYLTENGWQETPMQSGTIVMDTTLGLQQSGIMAFQIGSDATKSTSRITPGLHWLRAALTGKNPDGSFKNPAHAARAIAVHSQAATAVLQSAEDASEHLKTPLPAGRIANLAERNSAIKKVLQPYPSFAGSPAEQDPAFYTRVSERLRHKQRASSFWDMERIVLQQFPELFEVKVLPHTGFDEEGFYTEYLPGHTTVVVVPNLRNPNAVNPFQPRASAALREKVLQYLRPLCAAFATGGDVLHIINPVYEPILLSFSVGFHEGYDSGYYVQELQYALRRRLSPWAYDAGEDIRFGNRVYKSQLLTFVEQLEYVDYVTDFKLLRQQIGPGIGEMTVETDFVVRDNAVWEDTDLAHASTAASILVSAPQHQISPLRPDEYPCVMPEELCDAGGIGCWYVEIDLLVS